MKRRIELMAEAGERLMSCQWHWFQYHFRTIPPHPFALSMIDALAACDERIPGYGTAFLKAISSIANKKDDRDHYDQLLQRLAELLITRQCTRIKWTDAKLEIEPEIGDSKKRPDVVLVAKEGTLAIEIKAPAYTSLQSLRKGSAVQVVSRFLPDPKLLEKAMDAPLVRPRDNAVKDFLVSADGKFSGIRAKGACLTLLAIVWDDFIHEPISALTHEVCGLLTPQSFARDESGQALQYPNVDAILIMRHLHYFAYAAGDGQLRERGHAFDFGTLADLPNVLISNPASKYRLPDEIARLFRAMPLDDGLLSKLADYRPKDIILWFDGKPTQ